MGANRNPPASRNFNRVHSVVLELPYGLSLESATMSSRERPTSVCVALRQALVVFKHDTQELRDMN